MSALTGQRTEKLFDCIERASDQFSRRIPTAILNEVVNDATMWMAPPVVGPRAGRIYYAIQVSAYRFFLNCKFIIVLKQIGTAPPTIVLFVNDPSLFTDNYQRYLERKIRDALNFEGTPIKLIWRGKALRDVGRAAKKGDTSSVRFAGSSNLAKR